MGDKNIFFENQEKRGNAASSELIFSFNFLQIFDLGISRVETLLSVELKLCPPRYNAHKKCSERVPKDCTGDCNHDDDDDDDDTDNDDDNVHKEPHM